MVFFDQYFIIDFLRPGLPKWCHPRIFLFLAYGCINVSSIEIYNKIDTVAGYFSQYKGSNIGPIYIGVYGKGRFKPVCW